MNIEQIIEHLEWCLSRASKGEWTLLPRDVYFYNHPGPDIKPITPELIAGYDGDWLGADIVGPTEPGRATFVVNDAYLIVEMKKYLPQLLETLKEEKS